MFAKMMLLVRCCHPLSVGADVWDHRLVRIIWGVTFFKSAHDCLRESKIDTNTEQRHFHISLSIGHFQLQHKPATEMHGSKANPQLSSLQGYENVFVLFGGGWEPMISSGAMPHF